MFICVNKTSGLALLRHVRATGKIAYAQVCGLPEPEPSPQLRWSAKLIPHQLVGLTDPPSASQRVCVAVPSPESRPRASFFSPTVYSEGLPPGSFLQVGESLVIPCPELLFVELACKMHPAALELLGYELCGTYARSPTNPRDGGVTHGLAPVTCVDSIRLFIESCARIKGMRQAASSLNNICDNAWSSMESVCALLMKRPVSELGYGLGDLSLNARQRNPWQLVQRGCRESRVPDIVLEDHPIGFNYDGHDHLNLPPLLNIAGDETMMRLELSKIRSKYVDDRKRDRELAAQGRVVMPIVAEDIFAAGGLDTVVLEALMASERLGGPAKDSISTEVWNPDISRERQELIWSLLPWQGGVSLGAY